MFNKMMLSKGHPRKCEQKIYSDKIIQRTVKTKNLKETLEVFENNPDSTYSVGWMDLSANGSKKGRALVLFGEHAKKSMNLSSFKFPKFKIKIVETENITFNPKILIKS